MEPVAKAERYVDVMEVVDDDKDDDDDDGHEDYDSDRVNEPFPSLNYKVRPAIKRCIAGLFALCNVGGRRSDA